MGGGCITWKLHALYPAECLGLALSRVQNCTDQQLASRCCTVWSEVFSSSAAPDQCLSQPCTCSALYPEKTHASPYLAPGNARQVSPMAAHKTNPTACHRDSRSSPSASMRYYYTNLLSVAIRSDILKHSQGCKETVISHNPAIVLRHASHRNDK